MSLSKEKINDVWNEIFTNLKNKKIVLEKDINFDTSFMPSFYDNNDITKYDGFNVVYIGMIGIVNNGILLKVGKSARVFARDFCEHRNTYGKNFKLLFVGKTDNNHIVEALFIKLLKSKKLLQEIQFDGKNRTELFITTENFTVNDSIETLKKIISENLTKEIMEKNKEIKELQNDNNFIELQKEIEKTKQLDYEYKILLLKQKEEEEDKESDEDKNVCEIFLDNHIKETKYKSDKIFCVDMYSLFKLWMNMNFPEIKIPSDKEFGRYLKLRYDVKDGIRIDDKIRRGIEG